MGFPFNRFQVVLDEIILHLIPPAVFGGVYIAVVKLIVQFFGPGQQQLIYLLLNGFIIPEFHDAIEMTFHRRNIFAVGRRIILLKEGIGESLHEPLYLNGISGFKVADVDHLMTGSPIDCPGGCRVVPDLLHVKLLNRPVIAVYGNLSDLNIGGKWIITVLEVVELFGSFRSEYFVKFVIVPVAKPAFLYIHPGTVKDHQVVRIGIIISITGILYHTEWYAHELNAEKEQEREQSDFSEHN
jgi:hypothetical protein